VATAAMVQEVQLLQMVVLGAYYLRYQMAGLLRSLAV
jgi:hypothetical protein